MAAPELVKTLNYILNRCDAASIDVLAEAVVRRRRDLHVFEALGGIPDPDRMAKEATEKINAGITSGIEGMKNSVREMIVRIIKEHEPGLSESQIDELCNAWIPTAENTGKKDTLPNDVILSMVEQFISFSNGTMPESVDKKLRQEMETWPQRYWDAFPPVVRQIITDYLKDRITEKEFKSKIKITLGL